MNAKHTPGPWRAEEWRCHAATTVLVDDDTCLTGKRVIAECETEEDAHLIAAAPELLDFVAEYLDAWHSGMAGDSSMRRLAESLFEKATGASHVHDQ